MDSDCPIGIAKLYLCVYGKLVLKLAQFKDLSDYYLALW
jgi:hypothetical protein